MTIIEKLFDSFGYISKSKVKKYLLPVSKQTPESIQSEKTYAQLVDAYKSWVYTCIDKISKSVARLPLKLYVYRNSTGSKIVDCYGIKSSLKEIDKPLQKGWMQKQGIHKVEIEEHPFKTLIRRPNMMMTRFTLWYETMTRLELGGIVGWYLVRDGMRVPREIWPLPLTQNGTLQPKIESDLTIKYWLYRDGEIRQEFAPEELLIIKYPHPKSPFDWFSPLMAQMYPYDIDYYIQQQQANYYKNGVLPSMVAETDHELGKEQVTELLNQLMEQYGAPTKAGKVMLLHSGLKQGNNYSAKDSLLDEVVRYAREKLITAYDLSEGKVGLVRDVNRANMEALNETYIDDCLLPKTMMIEEILEEFLLPYYDKGLTLDFILPSLDDKTYELQKATVELQNYVITINEYREKEGREAVPWGDIPWGPLGVMPITSTPPAMMQQQEEGKAYSEKSMEPFAEWTAEQRRRAWLAKFNKRQKNIALFATNLTNFFSAQKARVLEKFDKYGEAALAKGVYPYSVKAIGPKDINLDKNEEKEMAKEFFRKFFVKIMSEAGDSLFQSLGLTVSFNLDQAPKKYLADRLNQFSESVTGTTFDDIEKILDRGYEEGKSYLDIKTELKQNFEAYEKYRSQLIVRTEVNSAMNKAEALAIKQEGLDKYLKKHWVTSNTENVRETHLEAERRYEAGIPINQDFIVGSDTMDMPGNGTVAKENINCLCNVLYSRNNVPI